MLRFPSQGCDLLLVSLLLGDIPRDLRCADNPAVDILDRRNGQRDRDKAPILALANGLEMVDVLPSPDAVQNVAFFIAPILRNNNCDGLPNYFLRRVAEDAFCALIPARDNAIEVLAYDCV